MRIGRALVFVQMGLSVLLVLSTGLLIQTLLHLHRVDPGFDVENLLIFRVNPGQAGYQGQDLEGFYEQTRETLAGIPGTRSVAFSSMCLLSGGMESGGFDIPGRSDLTSFQRQAHVLIVSDNFLKTMGIHILSGRHFNASDNSDTGRVAIVNETFASTFFPQEDILGKHIKRGNNEYQIIGLCRDAAYANLRDPVPPTLYFPSAQHPRGRMIFAVRSVVPPMSLVSTVRNRLAQIDRDIPLEELTTQQQVINKSMAAERLFSMLCGILSCLALSLCCIGLYGLMAYNVTRRTGEMGIRMAFGARPRDIARPILYETLVLATIGEAIGMPLALAVTQLMRSAFFGIKPYDPLTVTGSVALLLTIAVLAAWLPARRAAKVDPMEALRYE